VKLVRVVRQQLDDEVYCRSVQGSAGNGCRHLTTAQQSELGMQYTPVAAYVKKLVSYFQRCGRILSKLPAASTRSGVREIAVNVFRDVRFCQHGGL